MEPCRLSASDLACRRGERLLFVGLSLDLSPGEALEVRGANGTGKTSLLRMLAGLLRPYNGSVERKGDMAMLDQNLALDEHQPLGRALAFWQRLDGAPVGPSPDLGLDTLLDVPVRYLSTGQRKRAAIARLMSQRAPIWLLDEPLNGLDRDAVALVEALIGDHRAGGGIVVIASHQPIALRETQKLDLAEFAG
ncbi:heme ABC exporter ATP-binding protein CcmA [Aurantiacibacter aquimixticola]|uniref:Heme ABC exporter ATP-binding protein CcmA n=1 Tax=Aurantiacibacter aquimixticola TaxID=1958945 RepID=A0A419RTB0_9SPHN|nr:heme ABC exporter ATP-binding protein CcmA [Aurantiacibacter aquimixticola]RJY09018.1 heme ABC exporter ATP-binding protein CcmA [Aurantiacibacter aquimixticola]